MRVILRTAPAFGGRSLTIGREYEVLAIESDLYRLLDDAGEPLLFDADCFEIVDGQEPAFWVSTISSDGERYVGPPGWGVPGFFEAWHDRDTVVRRVFEEQLKWWYRGVTSLERPAQPAAAAEEVGGAARWPPLG